MCDHVCKFIHVSTAAEQINFYIPMSLQREEMALGCVTNTRFSDKRERTCGAYSFVQEFSVASYSTLPYLRGDKTLNAFVISI